MAAFAAEPQLNNPQIIPKSQTKEHCYDYISMSNDLSIRYKGNAAKRPKPLDEAIPHGVKPAVDFLLQVHAAGLKAINPSHKAPLSTNCLAVQPSLKQPHSFHRLR